MQDVYAYIEAHHDAALADLHTFCAQPSVSTEARGMAEMVALVRRRLEASGFAVEEIALEGGFPVLYAESQDPVPPEAPTLLIYNHYDVQPEGDSALWASPPFEPAIRDGMVVARGVADNKGNIIARLAAVDALRAVRGSLPVRIKWVIEGEEEIGSPHLDAFLIEHRERLAAEGCIWEFGTYTWDGVPQIMLGLKGIVEIALTARGANRDLHSSTAAYITSPVWRLVLALASIKDENEGINVPGFYDRMEGPTDTQIALIQALPDDDATVLANLGLEQFAVGLTGFQRHMAEIFAPTCNIQGIVAGYTGPGTKTVLPNQAHAKLDLRLVPDQDPVEIFELVKAHLVEAGFPDVEATMEPGPLFPARTDPDHPFVQLVMSAVRDAADQAPVVWPSSPASGPMYSFTNGLGVPVVSIGCGNPASAQHGPNENIRLADFLAGIKQIATVITRLGERPASDFHPVAATAAEADVPLAQVFETDSLFEMPPADFEFAAPVSDLTAEDHTPVDYSTMDHSATDNLFEMPSAEFMAAMAEPAPVAPPARKPRRPRKRKVATPAQE
jgi:acetylornithine deacetylase/succinyl-diaminopimelate desuccinylase-like protein